MKELSTPVTNNFFGFAWFGALLALLFTPGGAAMAQTCSFAPTVSYTSGVGILSSPHSVTRGDLNGDGLLDIVTANFYSGMVGVLLGMPGGSFAPVTTYPTGGGTTYSVALGDLNGDGRLDIITTNYNTNSVGVLLGQAGGTFAAPVQYISGPSTCFPYGIALGDVNNDGRLDVVVTNYYLGTVGVLLGQTGGTLGTVVQYATGTSSSEPIGVALGDLNGDGWLDIVTTNSTLNTSSGPPTGRAAVLLAQGGGRFAAPVQYLLSGVNTRSVGVALGDVNGDGHLDIIGGNSAGNTVGVLLGQGGGTFAAVVLYATGANSAPQSVALGDLNGDGQLDIVTGNYTAGTAGVLLGTGSGSFAAMTHYSTGSGSGLIDMTLGDVNSDGKLDIITVNDAAYSAGVMLNTTVYEPPTLRSVSPTNSPIGTSITLTGTYLSSTRAVRFNGTAATTFAVVNATTVTATVPPGATTGLLTVTTLGGTATGIPFSVGTLSAGMWAPPADVTLAPNPAHDAFVVRLPAGTAVTQGELLNALGQVVRRPAVAGTRFTVETAGLGPGVYSLRLSTGAGIVTKRVVID
ncbi:FG-GAP-like repeat-containing protein [Hymenobacter properus]|uniref:VCBS repeat-containing protein n=1 Tax=Hymenobacter properus TaxID=2791026 RepID=A0A931FKC5_9BACT|nr:FG-GAP-like repeat-containing protein [Hymenobacter properus]MBF9142888.1 VCBS repeat-containing protein [Hymenobacter properus]MBR7721695.1 VCBS repeat-containing protein [Microvirga sp. SRT04]